MVNPTYLVGVGGALGAICRYLVDEAAPESVVPLGTLSVNVLGSFVLAFVTFIGAGSDVLLLVGTGACGSFTTFSSFSVATVELWKEGSRELSVAFAAANLVGALVAIGLAWEASGLIPS
jgi:CrcB protein